MRPRKKYLLKSIHGLIILYLLLPGILSISVPCISKADLSFHLSPERLSWFDYQPERDTLVAPVLDLGGPWNYEVGRKKGAIPVPSCYSGYDGEIEFSRLFSIPTDWQNRSLILIFFGIRHRATMRINDVLLGSFQAYGLPIKIELPPQIVNYNSSNELIVIVDNEKSSLENLPLKSFFFSPVNYGGIIRGVFLQALPPERIDELDIQQVSKKGKDRKGSLNIFG